MTMKNTAQMLLFSILLAGCSRNETTTNEMSALDTQTPVTVTSVITSALADTIELNAISTFLQNNNVSANATGYIQKVTLVPGQYVTKGQVMFTLKTKEAASIGNIINKLDSSFKFSGMNTIRASRSGYVAQLLHQVGDYVQDGEKLAVISDRESFVFVMQLPYELRSIVQSNKNLTLVLPGGERLTGQITSYMPTVDSLSQTQGVVIRVNNTSSIPENLVAKVILVRHANSAAATLPKSAVLSNETQSDFWVMKLINDSTAVKTPVKTGIESGARVEIVSPKFSLQDRILVTGNYGLADTAKVKVVKP